MKIDGIAEALVSVIIGFLLFAAPDARAAAKSEMACVILPSGAWVGVEAENGHLYDSDLGEAILGFLIERRAQSLYDFGCGMGQYVGYFRNHGIASIGFDGNPDTVALTQGLGSVLELHVPVYLPTVDWVMSLEVGEHIPQEFESVFLDNVVRHAKEGVILSWAIPGQGGYGHFNEQPSNYIIEQLAKRGFRYLPDESSELRQRSSLRWFKNTVMVFERV